jgi:sugar phosphate isomerase/epimerase
MNFTGNPINVQLYTLREECKKDFPGTLRKVAEAGFGAVEFAGLYDHKAEEIKAVLQGAGLTASSCHVGLNDLQKDFAKIHQDYVTTLGCEYVIVPSGPRKFDDGGKTWKDFCAAMREMKKKCDAAGFKLGYHNHSFEFENMIDGKPAYDFMFHERPDESPLAEMDICWVANGKHDPVNEMRRLKGRVKLLHVKDLDPGPPPHDTEVGSGIIQWNAIYKTAEDVGVKWLVIERDHPVGSGLDSIKQSLAYLKAQGLEKVKSGAVDGLTSGTASVSGSTTGTK